MIDYGQGAVDNPSSVADSIRLPALIFLFLALTRSVFARSYDFLIARVFPNLKSDIMFETFNYLKSHSFLYFQKNFSGSFSNKINDITMGVLKIVIQIVDRFIVRLLTVLIAALTMLVAHPHFALILIIWSFFFITLSFYFSREAGTYSAKFSESRSHVMGKIVDSICNIFNVKLFAQEKHESEYLKNYLKDCVKQDIKLHRYILKVRTFQSAAVFFILLLMIWLLLEKHSQGQVTLGDFALILTLTTAITGDVFRFGEELATFTKDVGACSQALSIIAHKHDLTDSKSATTLQVRRGEIVFDSVHFHYNKENNIFTDKSITIHAGETVGLVGFSGSGKTTFVNLILRFFDVHAGQILIDGQNIKEVTQESLRQQIAVIPQDPVLFHRTIMENIRYARLDATDEEVIDSAKKARCHDFIVKNRGGYQSLVGERGIQLSGGQRQRIAIARAILKNAPILILDEASSALDSITESNVQATLAEFTKNRTTIVIAHRLSTLRFTNRLLVFDNGRIIEDGAHQELIKQQGHYAKLWSMQAGGFLVNTLPKKNDS